MARPIEPTPVLKGEDAFNFVKAMEEAEKVSQEEKEKMEEAYQKLKSWLTFDI
ncbi:MAG: hypothetical protein IJ213_04300 [Bacteroidales bacterium]|nr:hypothetical protein [Bacteroidales bacterium]MBQ9312249.1 hypothetical protein [Bacteroidales bacterium]